MSKKDKNLNNFISEFKDAIDKRKQPKVKVEAKRKVTDYTWLGNAINEYEYLHVDPAYIEPSQVYHAYNVNIGIGGNAFIRTGNSIVPEQIYQFQYNPRRYFTSLIVTYLVRYEGSHTTVRYEVRRIGDVTAWAETFCIDEYYTRTIEDVEREITYRIENNLNNNGWFVND